jgi:murein DD-endopeptidase MepM/ murein hydrolase activator NlpD
LASRRYSIVVADRRTGAIHRFTISLRPTLTTVAALFALPVLVGLGARWSATSTVDALIRENAALEVENSSYRDATGQLSSQLSSLQTAVDELGARAAVDPEASRAMDKLPSTVKSRAMGGSAAAAIAPVIDGALGSPDTVLGVLRDLLSILEGRLHVVRSRVERREALAAATPSIWPVTGWLSSSYGNRRDPFTGSRDFHPGLDISAVAGERVLAPANGTVITSARNGNYGNFIEIEHGFGITTRYGHLSRFAVAAGQHVRRGDVIGYVGSTGRSTSPHLHYEIWMSGRLTNPMKLLAR